MHDVYGRRMRRMTIVQDACPLVDQVGVVGVRDLCEARDALSRRRSPDEFA